MEKKTVCALTGDDPNLDFLDDLLISRRGEISQRIISHRVIANRRFAAARISLVASFPFFPHS